MFQSRSREREAPQRYFAGRVPFVGKCRRFNKIPGRGIKRNLSGTKYKRTGRNAPVSRGRRRRVLRLSRSPSSWEALKGIQGRQCVNPGLNRKEHRESCQCQLAVGKVGEPSRFASSKSQNGALRLSAPSSLLLCPEKSVRYWRWSAFSYSEGGHDVSFSVRAATCCLNSFSSLAILGRRLICTCCSRNRRFGSAGEPMTMLLAGT